MAGPASNRVSHGKPEDTKQQYSHSCAVDPRLDYETETV